MRDCPLLCVIPPACLSACLIAPHSRLANWITDSFSPALPSSIYLSLSTFRLFFFPPLHLLLPDITNEKANPPQHMTRAKQRQQKAPTLDLHYREDKEKPHRKGGRAGPLREGRVASSSCEEGSHAQACSIRSEQASPKPMEDRIAVSCFLRTVIPFSCGGRTRTMEKTIGTCDNGKKGLGGMLGSVTRTMFCDFLLRWRGQGRESNRESRRVIRMGDGDVQDQAHPLGSEPLRKVDVAHLPTGGAMLRNLGPSPADRALLMEGRHIARVDEDVTRS
eukprot:765763-Hanusia_phi.AAC.3